jgi:hypothetical protein
VWRDEAAMCAFMRSGVRLTQRGAEFVAMRRSSRQADGQARLPAKSRILLAKYRYSARSLGLE